MRRQDEVEARLEDLLCPGAGMGVRERRAGLIELREEATRHGDVEPAQVGAQRLSDVATPAVIRGGLRHDPNGAFQFYWMNWFYWPDHLGEALDELGRDLAEVSRPRHQERRPEACERLAPR